MYYPTKSDKCIHFSAFSEIHHVPDLEYYEKECFKSSIWYSPEELEDISSKMVTTARMLKDQDESSEHRRPAIVENDEEYCARGLESMVPEGRNSLESVDLLLAEQGAQKDSGVNDPEYLAKVYRFNSKPRIREAHRLALQDEKLVLDLLSPEEKALRKGRAAAAPSSSNCWQQQQHSSDSSSWNATAALQKQPAVVAQKPQQQLHRGNKIFDSEASICSAAAAASETDDSTAGC